MRYAPDALGRRVGEEGPRVTGMPISKQTAAQARGLGHPARRLRHARGAGSGDRWRHEVERSTLRQIKGLGGALLREKIVAEASQRFVVAPTSLRSWTGLGSRVPLAVEVVRFGHVATMGFSRYHARLSRA